MSTGMDNVTREPEEDSAPIALCFTPLTRSHTRIEVHRGGRLLDSDRADLHYAATRERIAEELGCRYGFDLEEIEQRMLEALEQCERQDSAGQIDYPPAPDFVAFHDAQDPQGNGLYQLDDKGAKKLTNFIMRIHADCTIEDMGQVLHRFEGVVELAGRSTPIQLSSEEFANNEGLKAAVLASAGPKAEFLNKMDIIRTAISRVSSPTSKRVTTSNGWDLAQMVYRAPGGWIDAEGYHYNQPDTDMTVDLEGEEQARWLRFDRLKPNLLPETKIHIIEDLLQLHERPVMHVLLAGVALAVLEPFAGGTERPAIWLQGLTGAGKSLALRLAANFFGDFDPNEGRRFMTWGSTANAIQRQGAYFRHAIFPVDDYKPGIVDQRSAVYILQNYSDGTGRGRLRRDATPNQTRPIQGLLISTGEDIPQHNASTLARTIIVQVPNRPKDFDRGGRCRRNRHRYRGLMSDFIARLIRNGRLSGFSARVDGFRDRYITGVEGVQNSARIARNFGMVAAAFDEMAMYLSDVWPCWETERRHFFEHDLMNLRDRMLQTVSDEQTSNIFLEVLRELLSFGRVRIESLSTPRRGESNDRTPLVGRVVPRVERTVNGNRVPNRIGEGDEIIGLSIALAMEAVQRSLRDQGRPALQATHREIIQQLAQDGMLRDRNGRPLDPAAGGDRTHQARLGGRQNWCVFVTRRDLLPPT